MFIIDIMMAISNWLWGWPLLILTSAVAVYLSVRFKFFQFTRFGHAMKNTFGKIFDKGDGEGMDLPYIAAWRGRYFPVPGLLHGAGLHAWRGEHRRCIGGHRHRRPWRRILDVGRGPHGLHREVFRDHPGHGLPGAGS